MIHVDRELVAAPSSLLGSEAQARRKWAAEYFGMEEAVRHQNRFDFSLKFAQPGLRDTVRRLFRDKCAYCEKALFFEEANVANLDRFRPVSGAMGVDGEVRVDWYWWLAFDWRNMYACCPQCNRAKGSRFPVEGLRAHEGASWPALVKEKALLLDPCAPEDSPDAHLLFDDNGHVSGKTLRGRTTVEVFSLNRPELVLQRLTEAKKVAKLLSSGMAESLLEDHHPFAALRRQMFMRKYERSKYPADAAIERTHREQREHEKKHSEFSLAEPSARDRSRERARTRYIERVKLRNVGIHESLDLSMASADSVGAPWMMLLGENGVGKSTVLKAIAFALAGKREWERLGPHAKALLPLQRRPKEHVAEIELRLSDGESIRMRIDTLARKVTGNAANARLFMLAFGATRLPSNGEHPPPEEPVYARMKNLFDPFSPLGDAQQWLLGLPELQFERACRTLRLLLDLPEDALFGIKDGRVTLKEGGIPQDMTTLSDGRQTIIAVGCDIMSVLLGPDLPVEHAEGIVLIDEIGNHLHPAWRMRIVAALKSAFPRVQFIATTHEPLCLRGLDNDEVAVLRKDAKCQVHLLADLPPIRGLLVDQILSSPHFGMHSTVDPEFAQQIDEYLALVAKSALSPTEQSRLDELAPLMKQLRQIGCTPREEILLRTIDNYLAKADESLQVIDPAQVPADLQSDLDRLLQATGAGTALPAARRLQ